MSCLSDPEEVVCDVTAPGLLSSMGGNLKTGIMSQKMKMRLGVAGTLVGLLLIGVLSLRSHPKNIAPLADDVTLLIEADVAIPADQVEVSPPRAQCARIGESCKESNCCRFSGYKCYRKDDEWSSCLKTCKKGHENGDKKSDKPIVQKGAPDANGMVPIHAKPFFKPAPPGPWTCKRTPNLKPAAQPEGTTLFCFTVALSKIGPDPKPKFQDPKLIDLVKTQHQTKSGIFGCEDWMVFSDSRFELTPGPPQLFATAVDFPKPAVRPNTKQWQNTPLFANVWRDILESGRHVKQDWTVKVDPTTVFLPIRLRKYLKTQKVTDNGIYLENCKYVRYGFHGSLAVMDKKASSILAENFDNCLEELPWKNAEHAHFTMMGEDKFSQRCMDFHGVDKIPSTYEVGKGQKEGLHTTITCPAHIPKDLPKSERKDYKPPCGKTWTAAMHAFKKPEDYFKCLRETQALDTHTDEHGQYFIK